MTIQTEIEKEDSFLYVEQIGWLKFYIFAKEGEGLFIFPSK